MHQRRLVRCNRSHDLNTSKASQRTKALWWIYSRVMTGLHSSVKIQRLSLDVYNGCKTLTLKVPVPTRFNLSSPHLQLPSQTSTTRKLVSQCPFAQLHHQRAPFQINPQSSCTGSLLRFRQREHPHPCICWDFVRVNKVISRAGYLFVLAPSL